MANLTYLSFTGWKTYQTCPQQYKLSYIDKKRPPMEDMVNVIKGQCLHDLMEAYLLNKENDPNWLIEHGPQYWEKGIQNVKDGGNIITWKNPNDEQVQREKFLGWTVELAKIFKKHNLDPAKIHPEFKADCYVTLGPHRFKMGGRIDMLLKNKNGDYVILDLKGSERKEVVVKDQISWYAILSEYFFEKEGVKVTHGGFVLPGFKKDENKFQLFEIPEAAKEKLRNEIIDTITKIKNDEFPTTPQDNTCFWCPVKTSCPLFNLGSQSGIVQFGAS